MKSRLILLSLWTLTLTLPAAAQQAVNQSGRALDANLGVGTGGINANAPQTDYRLRNDLVTGNVAGGFGFQGTIDYTAPGEFQGTLGSDDLFNFRAQSLYSAPSLVNTPSFSHYGNGVLAPTPVFRSFTSFASQGLDANVTSLSPHRFEGDLRGISPTTTSYFASALSDQSTTGSFSSLRSNAGLALAVSESPLLGVRQLSPTAAEPAPLTEQQQQQLDELNKSLNKDARIGQTPQQLPTDQQQPESTEPTDAGINTPQGDQTNLLPSSPTLALGQQLQPNAPQQWFSAKQWGDQLLNNPQAKTQPSVYGSLLAEVKAAASDQNKARTESSPYSSNSSMDLEQPDQSKVHKAEQLALDAIRRAYGLPESTDMSQDQTLDETQLNPTTGESSDVDNLLGELNYDLPEIRSMAGSEKTRSNQLLEQAEAAMASDDFFKAESDYKQAAMLTPDDPMPWVGMVHAQLGAGMIRSSALNLRRLFERHPELIAARYDAKLLPSAERLRWVQGELNQMIDSPEATSDPGIMMAYLGYQVQSRQLIRYGLAMAQSRDPRDPLLPVLRRIWLDTDAASAASPTPQTPAAAH